jgi:hypothetical protein
MNTLITQPTMFSIGPLTPLHGLEGETIIVSGNYIAAISSAEAIWNNDSGLHKVALPYVPVKHASWSIDRKKIFVGQGTVDTVDCCWKSHPVLSNIIQPTSPGKGGLSVKTTSWSRDGCYVVVLIDWSGPRDQAVKPSKIMLYNISLESPPITLPIKNADDVLIVGNHVIVLASEVSVWSFSGEQLAKLPTTIGIPFRISVSVNEDYLALINNDWSVRIVDTSNWEIKFTWKGYFRDIVITDLALIALDLEGNLHAACLTDEGIELIGIVNTGVLASQLAITDDKHLIMMGVGPVSVHSATYKLNCGNRN